MDVTITRNGFVKFSLDGCCGKKVKFTRGICRRKLSTGSHRTNPTMSTITRNGFVRFSVDGRFGKKMKLTRTCFICPTKPPGVIHHVRKTRKCRQSKSPIRSCACGDIYCNYISKFLGTMITEKCCYPNPAEGKRGPNKQFRCEKIHKKLVMFRKERNDLFTTQVPTYQAKFARFNEIHYPIAFLIRAVKRSKSRIPVSIDVEEAKETNMYKEDLLRYYKHERKTRVAVVPTLNVHQAIQACFMC